jgi:cytochrome P450
MDLPFGFDPLSREFRARPYDVYARLQREEPIHRSPLGMLVLTRYDDVAAVVKDPRFGMGEFWPRQSAMLGPGAATRMGAASLFFKDPPDHTRLRNLVSRAFTPRAIAALRPRIATIVDELLAPAREARAIDVMRDFAFPLPVLVIAEMLGMPTADRDLFHAWTQSMNLSFEPVISPEQAARCHAAVGELEEYLLKLVRARRDALRDDLLSSLIQVQDGGDRLSEAELVGTAALLLSAGYETTMGLIGNGALALVANPAQTRHLVAEPGAIPNAVEEFMRFDSPVQFTAREPLVDVEVAGQKLHPGELCLLVVAAANRDPAHFDEPTRLDVGRANAGDQLSFGGGRHFCLGAPLARLEGAIAFAALAPLLDGAELATDTLVWRDSFLNHALESLPLRLSRG